MAAGTAQFGLGDKGYLGVTLGMDQRAHLVLATVGHSAVAFHEARTAGFDSSWRKYLPSIQYRHAGRYGFYMHANRLQAHKGRAQVAINSIANGM
jgi:hypothetical protein